MKPAVFLDMDETLTHGISWLKLTTALGGSIDDLLHSLKRLRTGDITLAESNREVIANWSANRPLTRKRMESAVTIDLQPGAKSLVDYVRTCGYEPVLISGALDVYVHGCAETLGIQYWYANASMVYGNNDVAIDIVYEVDQAQRKLEHAHEWCASNGVEIGACIAIGDGENDQQLFAACGSFIQTQTEQNETGLALGDIITNDTLQKPRLATTN